MPVAGYIREQKQRQTIMIKLVENAKKLPIARRTKNTLTQKIADLETLWGEFKETNKTIQHGAKEEDFKLVYFQEDVYSQVFEVYSDGKADIQELFPPEDLSSSRVSRTHDHSSINQDSSYDLKLPRIQLPQFSGDYTQWTTFHDLFKTLVHQNDRLSAVQKLHYLSTSLSGEPKRLIQHFQITQANYGPAWEMLKDRYQNNRVLVNSYLKTLLSQHPITSENATQIKKLLDTTNECLRALANLNVPTDQWDTIIIYLTLQKLPQETHQLWEQSLTDNTALPTFNELTKFLETRFRTLEFIAAKPTSSKNASSPNQPHQSKIKSFNTTSTSCCICSASHSVRQCETFAKLSAKAKLDTVKQKRLCLNCLDPRHAVGNCTSKFSCFKCRRRHNTILHDSYAQPPPAKEANTQSTQPSSHHASEATTSCKSNQISSNFCETTTSSILLATAVVKITTDTGTHFLRALLDQGSEASFVTETAVQILGLKRTYACSTINGIGQAKAGTTKGKVALAFTSRFSLNPVYEIAAFILPKLTDMIPSKQIVKTDWNHLDGLALADPGFHTPNQIDLLFGADIYAELLLEGIRRGPPNTPIAQNSRLGWFVSGRVDQCTEISQPHIASMTTTLAIDGQLRRFWELEEIMLPSSLTDEEKECERIFQSTYTRNTNGRFVVQLPFKASNHLDLGESKSISLSRFYQLERRFKRDENFHREYTKCLEEYKTSQHMVPVSNPTNPQTKTSCYHLPHHAVIKESSTSTKLRVVFDASQKTTTGQSLNDVLLTGPTIQDDLLIILLRWRTHGIVFSADIEKMYRQVLVDPTQHRFQRIFWRKSPTEGVKEYALTTVTFGTTSAPYLAIKALRTLAELEREKFPLASKVTLTDFYVDNILSGADTISDAVKLQTELLQMLNSGGFPLKKWSANHEMLTSSLPAEFLEKAKSISLDRSDEVKTLGIAWSPTQDQFFFNINLPPIQPIVTKRSILSDVSRLFDPLGWISPILITGKIMIQTLWLHRLDWDDEVDAEVKRKWLAYREALQDITIITIPRWIHTTKSTNQSYQLHGFCDASMAAYAAVVYLRVTDHEEKISISLLTAKTKVAPIKTISLPRLELCGMSLLAKLVAKILPTLPQPQEIEQHIWTDSTIVLSWLQGAPSQWKTFVANRVTKIHEKLQTASWHHVPTNQNPADLGSRGVSPKQLAESSLWWGGPSFLRNDKSTWPKSSSEPTTHEKRKIAVLASKVTESFAHQFSSLTRLIRVTAYILRFISRVRNKIKPRTIWISSDEYENARLYLIKEAQEHDFASDIKALKSNRPLPDESKLKKLTPFLDHQGILRVGGRIQASLLSDGQQHPIIIDGTNHLSTLIVENIHRSSLHGGTTLVLSLIRKTYWITNGRNLVKTRIFKCIACHRQRAKMHTQLMGNLPAARVVPSRPFSHTGVDYCGPFGVKMSKGRGARSYKGYISLFICLSTKAIHLEVVSDYTTEAFLAAFKRFTSRRGLCTDLYSDCGTNFVGAKGILDRDLQQAIKESIAYTEQVTAQDGTRWHLIPPASPHFGGLWEAGVKSLKFHLKRILSDAKLSFEEWTTVTAQIEASLNSRPLCPLHDDADSLEVLTPGHFLIGDALRAPPEPSTLDEKISTIDRWKYLQQLTQRIWKKWSTEYLSRLQQRPKWNKCQPNPRVGALVLLKDDRLPPSKWSLGRIVELHPGDDDLVRVVTLKTKNAILKRPITKISLLPIDDPENIINLYKTEVTQSSNPPNSIEHHLKEEIYQ